MEAETPLPPPFDNPLSLRVWEIKYRLHRGGRPAEARIEDTWQRVAAAIASVEGRDAAHWSGEFRRLLEGFRFLPGGRILAGAGTGRRVTLFNCFVMGLIDDSMDGIFDSLKEGALTMQQGGGIGYDFSTLRPRGTRARGSGTIASGPVSFMEIWDRMCATILSTGARRGAMMATLRCDHPDIEEFITAKHSAGRLQHFNLSVQVSDAFMEAVRADGPWELVFPQASLDDAPPGETRSRRWTGSGGPVPCRVFRTLPARALWRTLMDTCYDSAEPGVLFVDRINALNNLHYREHITATNPCGEIPLPPYGACDLGSLNLTRFVLDPFTARARLDLEALATAATVAVRFLDDVIDASRFPLEAQAAQEHGSRRIGLGLTGLADTLVMLGLRYDTEAARALGARAMETICNAAYRASIELARSKGPFPFLDRDRYLQSRFLASRPADIRDGIARHGIRNSHLTAIAPTGTISLLADNVSSGLEPIFADRYRRAVRDEDDRVHEYLVEDHAIRLWRRLHPNGPALPPAWVDVRALAPRAHLDMQAALQAHVDNAISKTINVPADYPRQDFERIFDLAHELGLKGCTAYRPTPVRGAVLQAAPAAVPDYLQGPHCCNPEREAD